MKMIVEIGTEEQKEQIRSELSIIKDLSDQIDIPIKIIELIVPIDFDNKINELLGINSYKAIRKSQAALAKVIQSEHGVILVFSPILFTNDFDYDIRLLFYIHEYFHVINKFNLPILESITKSNDIYLKIIYENYDEYYAIRKSMDTINTLKEKSFMLKKYIQVTFKRFIDIILDEQFYYELCAKIIYFRSHADIDKFFQEIRPYINETLKTIVNIFAYMDSNNKLKNIEPLLYKTRFINENTFNLMNCFRKKYLDGKYDLSDGIILAEKSMINFGIKFEDTEEEGIYCHVLNI